MSPRNLLSDPVCLAEELGEAIPPSLHAVSVALPQWGDVVGYEEKQPRVMDRLKAGYPRFVVHSLVRQLAKAIEPARPCLPFPSASVAALCADFVGRSTGQPAEIIPKLGVFGVATTPAGADALRAFWQHTGLIVTTRQAGALLDGRPRLAEAEELLRALRRQLAEFYDCGEDDVFLTPTGMAAQFAALSAVMRRTPGLPTAQLGFPYVDTLKLQQKLGHGGILLHDLARITRDLENLVSGRNIAGCFCEIPGNPLLGSADVARISPLLRANRIPLVVDDVVATPANVDLGGHADLVATSLTKFIAGTCDVMGGAVLCNPRSPLYGELKAILCARHEELLWPEDALVLRAQAGGFPERMKRHNANGLFIAGRLRGHPAVERVWYPRWEFAEAYEAVRRKQGGWVALVTFLPRNAASASPEIFNRLRVCKGPSLGTVFTLACPFTLLAHYTELEWAESCGVSRHLIRLSIGLEEPGELWRRVDEALTGTSRPVIEA
jgi:cystathionine gamma-synthase